MNKKTQLDGLLSPLLQKLRFKNALPFVRGTSYLDIGCSLGEITTYLPKGIDYVGVEGSLVYYNEAVKNNPDYKFFNLYIHGENVDTLPFQQESFDTIIALAVIEHMNNPRRVLSGLKRYLKKNGIIVISTPDSSIEYIHQIGSRFRLFSSETHEHKELFDKKRLFTMVVDAGYKIIHYHPFEFWMNHLIVLENLPDGNASKEMLNEAFKKYGKDNFIGQLLKYGVVSLLGYSFLFFGTYFLIEKLGLVSHISYLIVTSLAYLWFFFASTKFIFHVDSDKSRIIRYVIAIFVFWLLNNTFFNILTLVFDTYYVTAILINIALLGVLRFFVYKKFVFKG